MSHPNQLYADAINEELGHPSKLEYLQLNRNQLSGEARSVNFDFAEIHDLDTTKSRMDPHHAYECDCNRQLGGASVKKIFNLLLHRVQGQYLRSWDTCDLRLDFKKLVSLCVLFSLPNC